MNTKKQTLIVSILLVIFISALLVVRNAPPKVSTQKKKDAPPIEKDTATPGMERFVSVDGSFQFEYPKEWNISFTTPKKGRGEFGIYIQTWKVTSFQVDLVADELPENAIQIEFEIVHNDDKVVIDNVITCEMKSTECTQVMINKTVYKQDKGMLNVGTEMIRVGTVKKNKVYKVTAQIAVGDKQNENKKTVEKILRSFTLL